MSRTFGIRDVGIGFPGFTPQGVGLVFHINPLQGFNRVPSGLGMFGY